MDPTARPMIDTRKTSKRVKFYRLIALRTQERNCPCREMSAFLWDSWPRIAFGSPDYKAVVTLAYIYCRFKNS